MPPAKNSMRSDLLLHKPTNSGEEPDFFDYVPLLTKNSYWFEVGRILRVTEESGIKPLVERQIKAIRDMRGLPSHDADIVEFNLTRLYESIWVDEIISYHTEVDADHERILEIFVRANSGGTELS